MPVVGVGASAGGLAALEAFFSGLPPSPGMAFIVVVHLLPEVESHLAELLQRHTGLIVRQVTREATLEVDHVYVIPPDHNLGSLDGKVELLPRGRSGRNRTPIDLLMTSLARTHGRRSAGVILSGTGSDGTVGLQRIREAGGITMVQDPDEAAFPEMLQAALRVGVVDALLPASRLGAELVRVFRTELQDPGEPDDSIAGILTILRERLGRDFAGYKESTLQRRIRRRLPMTGNRDLREYRSYLEGHPDEVAHLGGELLIGVTRFFRDPDAFAALSQKVLAPLVARGQEGDRPIRMWVAGCSTGEEAYTLAMLLDEAGGGDAALQVRIFATDVDATALEVARTGSYPQGIVLDLSAERLERYFTLESGGYRVRKELRERVLFAAHDLLQDPPFSSLDLVVCRNVLIYLKPEAQERIMGLFRYSLRDRGHLLLGTAETADQVPQLFNALDPRHRIYRTLPIGSRALSRVLPSPLLGAPRPRPSLLDPSPVKSPSPRSFGLLHHDLVELYAPPSLLVTEDLVVVHLSENVWRYLRLRGGEPFSSLPELLPDEMAGEVRVLMEEAMRSLSPVTGSVSTLENGHQVRPVIRPYRPAGGGGTFALVIFEPVDGQGVERVEEGMGDGGELAAVRLQLRQAFEAHDRTLQEYRTAYAELQVINEEQKVTGEELESSKEELQSVNEELRTINQEHREKIEELARVNADLKNLIDSAEVALIFLDRELRIRRFTPAVAELFHFRPSDLGRPVGEITSTLRYPRLMEDARQVLEDEQRLTREVDAQDDRWYGVQVVPYRSFAGAVEGVVATFLEVTERKKNEAEMERLLGEARRAERARSNLFGMLAHEFRPPLSALEEAAGALSPEIRDTEGHVLSERILRTTDRVRTMLDEMLEGRVDRASTHTTGVDATRVVAETVELLRARASEQGLRLTCRVETSLPATSTDGWRLHRLTSNLVENALEAGGRGEVGVHLRADPPWLVVDVEDQGRPLPSSLLDWLNGRTQEEPDFPPGREQRLRAIRELAGLASGRLEVSCAGESGCRFCVHLPLPTSD